VNLSERSVEKPEQVKRCEEKQEEIKSVKVEQVKRCEEKQEEVKSVSCVEKQ
jgi:hypothetical protein